MAINDYLNAPAGGSAVGGTMTTIFEGDAQSAADKAAQENKLAVAQEAALFDGETGGGGGGVTDTGVETRTISQEASDIANEQGVAYKKLAKSRENQTLPTYTDYGAELVGNQLDSRIDFDTTESYIDKAKSTVAGQLKSLLASDSPYIQQQEAKAQEQAQSRGLLNSTLAAQAGREAAIDAALPIAQADAGTYAKGDLARMQAEQNIETIQSEAIVSGEMVKQKAAIEQQNRQINDAFSAKLQGASEQSKVWLADLQNNFNTHMQNLQSTSQQMLLETELDSVRAQSVREHAASLMQNYQISVENMLTDPDFLALDDEDGTVINNALNQLQTIATNSINFIGASANVNMEPFLDAYMEPINAL